MAMTKKHYEAVARRIKHRIDTAVTEHAHGLIHSTAKKAVLAAMNELACDLAFDFRADNPNFDEGRFLKACGF
jgi:hypothetical protein